MRFNKAGLTRAEMIAATVIALIFIGLSIPKAYGIYANAKEGNTKYNLGRIRAAIAAYYGDHKGTYPTDDLGSLVPAYIEKIPEVTVHGYPDSNKVHTKPAGKGGWFYASDKSSPDWGGIRVDIDAVDRTGKLWEKE